MKIIATAVSTTSLSSFFLSVSVLLVSLLIFAPRNSTAFKQLRLLRLQRPACTTTTTTTTTVITGSTKPPTTTTLITSLSLLFGECKKTTTTSTTKSTELAAMSSSSSSSFSSPSGSGGRGRLLVSMIDLIGEEDDKIHLVLASQSPRRRWLLQMEMDPVLKKRMNALKQQRKGRFV